MKAIRLLRLGVAMSAMGGMALIFAALTGRVAVPVGVVGAGLLYLLVIPMLLFFRMTLILRTMNEERTSPPAAQDDPSDAHKVGQNPS